MQWNRNGVTAYADDNISYFFALQYSNFKHTSH